MQFYRRKISEKFLTKFSMSQKFQNKFSFFLRSILSFLKKEVLFVRTA